MTRTVLLRLLSAVPNLIGVVVVTFLLTRALPGDPAAFFAGAAATPEAVEQVRAKLGLNRPLVEQFLVYVGELARGELGDSLSTGQPVATELRQRLPASLELTFCALAFALAVSVPLGVAAAVRPGSWIDHLCRLITTAGVSLPTFFTGLLLSYLFYFVLGWAPSPLGRLDPSFPPPPGVTHMYLIDSLLTGDLELTRAAAAQLLLPAVTMGLFVLAPLARMTRASMIAVLSSDFIRTARASGLGPFTVLIRYGLRNAMLPIITTMGMVFSFLLGSNVLVEKVFAWPGIGSYAIESLTASDYAPIQGFVLMMGAMYVVLNLLIDLAYAVIDPRVRVEG
ncbi:MAG TPA: ABC transporter permease [Burkholderiaceae bacterium]|nr:ABC transporter permease [Burkholderiaceae bacterium]